MLLPEEQEIRFERLTAYKGMTYKYGVAMIVLVLNNYAAPYLFSFILLIPAMLFGVSAETTPDLYYTLLLLINELSAYVLPILVLMPMFLSMRREFVPDKTYKSFTGEALLLFISGVAAGSFGSILTDLISKLMNMLFHTEPIQDAFTGMTPQDPYQFWVFTFCICVIAPVCEEFIFRDILLKPLRCFNDAAAAVFTGLVFGLYHGNFDQFAYAALLGLFYSIIAVRANSILPTILLHSLNNLLVCLSSYLPDAYGDSIISDTVSVLMLLMVPAGIIALIIAVAKKCFDLHSHDRFVSGKEAAKMLVLSPAVIIGFAVMLASFFI